MSKTSKYVVEVRGGFSDRMKLKPISTEIQINDLDDRTRIAIINTTNQLFNFYSRPDVIYDYTWQQRFIRSVLSKAYKQKIDYNYANEYSSSRFLEIVSATIENDDFDEALTLVELFANELFSFAGYKDVNVDIYKTYNQVFKAEYVGYRFVNKIIVPIADEEEGNEIEKSVNESNSNVKKHLSKALEKIADRNSPDYENSIKESISAVEAMCQDILGEKGSLGDALKKIEKCVAIHPALKEAFKKLYGYTSDAESGIRHAASVEGGNSTFAEARFMIVACSAFINYLKINMADTDI